MPIIQDGIDLAIRRIIREPVEEQIAGAQKAPKPLPVVSQRFKNKQAIIDRMPAISERFKTQPPPTGTLPPEREVKIEPITKQQYEIGKHRREILPVQEREALGYRKLTPSQRYEQFFKQYLEPASEVANVLSLPFMFWKGKKIPKIGKKIPKLGIPTKPIVPTAPAVTPQVTPVTPEVTKLPTKAITLPMVKTTAESVAVRQKILEAIEEQKRLLPATKRAYAEARAPKFAKAEELRQKAPGSQILQEQMGKLEGKLPYAAGENVPQIKLTPEELEIPFKDIDASALNTAQSLNAKMAWMRITDPTRYAREFAKEAAIVPPNKGLRAFEIEMFRKVWGSEYADKLAADQKWLLRRMKANDTFFEVYYNSLLGGKSVVRNFIFNALRMPLEVGKTGFLVGGDILTSGFGKIRPRQRFAGEIKQEIIGQLGGFSDGIRSALRIIKTGERFVEPGHEMSEKVIKGKLGTIINIPSRLMDAGDAFFFEPFKKASLYREAYRVAKQTKLKGSALLDKVAELKAAPTPDMIEKSQQESLKRLLREKSTFGDALIGLRDKRLWGFTPLKIITPFLKVPINLAKFGLENSPIGALNPRLYYNILHKDPKAAQQLGDLMAGTATAALAYLYMAQGKITGASPVNKADADRFYNIEKKQPFSVLIGDRWVSYQQLPIINTVFPMIGAAYEAHKNKDKNAGEKVTQAVYTIARGIADQPFLTSLSDALDAVTDPERSAEAFVKRTVPSLVPASGTTRLAAQAIDTTVRQPKNVLEGIKANIPFLSRQVPPRLTATGEEIKRETPFWSPVNITKSQETKIGKELGRLDYSIGFVGNTISGIKLTDEEKREYQRLAGAEVKSTILRVMELQGYYTSSDEVKREVLEREVNKARDRVRKELLPKLARAHPDDPAVKELMEKPVKKAKKKSSKTVPMKRRFQE